MIDSMVTAAFASTFGWRDALDILLMTVLIYQIVLLLKGTRALQTLIGVLLVVLAYWATAPDRILYLRTTHRVLGSLLFYAPFALIVLFQTTIRRFLAHLGRTSFLRLDAQEMTEKMLDDIVRAAVELAARTTGALIVIEREQALPDQLESGSQLDAAISHDLLMNIFTPGSLFHDGAVIIGDGRVKAACCFLPVTNDPQLSREYGSRHRAAIGLTEEYDSLVIVVSEERGTICVASEGRLSSPLDGPSLKSYLRRNLGQRRDAPEVPARAAGRRPDAA
jgi:diadenylate cyclase